MKTIKIAGSLLLALMGLFLVASFLAQPQEIVRGKAASRPLADELTPAQAIAQEAALLHPEVRELTRNQRTEVFGVQNVGQHFTAAAAACAQANCQQVNIYNFDTNTTISVIVNADTAVVLDILVQPQMQPGINKRLADHALELAYNHPEVVQKLGFVPTHADMVPVPGGLANSSCGLDHLCVAPTFVIPGANQMLWVVVDLTEDRVAGTALSTLDPNDIPVEPLDITGGCPSPGSVNQHGWQMNYDVTASDGLRVYNVSYNGVPVLTSGKLAEWHVDYNSGSSGFVDVTGCGGGGGFPIYPYGDTVVRSFQAGSTSDTGFEVVQDFRMGSWGNSCNYRYEQHWQFFADGRFRVVTGSFGKGCNYNGGMSVYRPVIRLDVAIDGDADDTFSRWDGSEWQEINQETYLTPYDEADHGAHETNGQGYSWRVLDDSGMGFHIVMDVGQFAPEERGDEPFWYITRHRPSEGDADLGSFGSGYCCNDNHQQGPEIFVNNETIGSENIVLWYVAQNRTSVTEPYYCWTLQGEPNPITYPCFSGPMFVPIGSAVQAGFDYTDVLLLGETAVFTNTTIGSEPISYTWDFGDGSPLSSAVNPTHTYAAIGNYTVTLTATNADDSDSATGLISVLEVPVLPTAAFSVTSNTATFPISFTNQSTGPGSLSFLWDFGDGSPLSSAVHPTHTYALPLTYTVTLTATNKFGDDTAVLQLPIFAPESLFLPSLLNQLQQTEP
jgi:hypothetical protein